MKIEVLQKLDYKGYSVYIRKLDNIFEYLIIFQGELYCNYFDIKPEKHGYTKKQLSQIVKLVLIAACRTIDALMKKKK